MARQVVIDYQNIPTLIHEPLGHGCRCVGSNELQARSILTTSNDHDCSSQRSSLLEFCDDARHRISALANRTIDGYNVRTLIEDRIDRDRGLADLTISQNELSLATPDRYRRIDRLDPRRKRDVDSGPVDNRGRGPLDRPPASVCHSRLTVQGPSQGINNPTEKALSDRRVNDTMGAAHVVAGTELVSSTEENNPASADLDVGSHAGKTMREQQQLSG